MVAGRDSVAAGEYVWLYWRAMRSIWMMVAGSVFLAIGWAQSLDPVIADPQHHHLEFQNQWVRIIRD